MTRFTRLLTRSIHCIIFGHEPDEYYHQYYPDWGLCDRCGKDIGMEYKSGLYYRVKFKLEKIFRRLVPERCIYCKKRYKCDEDCFPF